MGVVCLGALSVMPTSLPVAGFIIGWLGVTNLVLTVFNLIPAFPMDGGRVLRALLSRRRGYASATRTAASVGKGFAVLFALVGVLSFSPTLLLLALFLYGAAAGESRVVVGELLDGLTVGDLLGDEPGVSRDATVGEAVRRLMGARRTSIPVTDGRRVVGVLTAEAVRDVEPADHDTPVGDYVDSEVPRLAVETDASEALATLEEGGGVALVERDGNRVGVVAVADFTSFLDLRGA